MKEIEEERKKARNKEGKIEERERKKREREER
jgi:hypothetical protein